MREYIEIQPATMYQKYIEKIQAAAENFIRTDFLLSNGGIRTTYKETTYTMEYATGNEVLSESQGLLMRYAALTKDEELFLKILDFVEKKLLLEQTISYRYSEVYGIFQCNAAIDDFRIIRALFEAATAFENPAYLDIANRYGKNLYQTNTKDNMLSDYYDEQYRYTGETLTLCYADFITMRLLGERDKRWNQVYASALNTVQNGYISDEFPLYYTSYDYHKKNYSKSKITTCQALLTAIHLAEIGQGRPETPDYVKRLVRERQLYSSYNIDGLPLNNVHSTANYALASILGYVVEDSELQHEAIRHMLLYWVEEKDSPVYGGFADMYTLEAYSFDNLNALLALELVKSKPVGVLGNIPSINDM